MSALPGPPRNLDMQILSLCKACGTKLRSGRDVVALGWGCPECRTMGELVYRSEDDPDVVAYRAAQLLANPELNG